MKLSLLRRVLAALACALACMSAGAAARYVDDAGRSVSLQRPAQRVVTLAPSLTEFVYAVGAGAALVGTMDTSNYPEQARRVPRIGDYQRLDVERIVALKPDLIFVWYHGNQGRELAQLEAAGIALFYLEPRRLDDIPRALERVGGVLGHAAEANAAAARWRRELATLRAAHAHAEPVSVFFQVWPRPLMTLNGEHFTSDLMALCGGRNVFSGLTQLAPQVSVESVVAADPEVIFVAREQGSGPAWERATGHPSLQQWQAFGGMTAVKRHWMFSVSGDLVTRQGPRALDGAKAMCEVLDRVRSERGR